MELLEIKDLKKGFIAPDGTEHRVIDVPEFVLTQGQQVAIRGESGSGKTTFLNLIAGILRPDAGDIHLAGSNIATLGEADRDRHRAIHVGYIFQTFNLLQGYTCLENVLLGMAFGPGVDRARAESLLQRVGLGDKLHHRPRQLSTGQQQRVAVARALANKPKLVLADEPTGNLDAKNAREAIELIQQSCKEENASLLLVSHDPAVLYAFDNVRVLTDINLAAEGAKP